jgi:transposase InsO family protein
MVTPAARREAVAHLRTSFEVSERRACVVLGVDRTSVRYRSSRPDDAAVRARLRELAAVRRRFGYRRLLVLMRREGLVMNHKKFRRLYREERLQVRRRPAQSLASDRPVQLFVFRLQCRPRRKHSRGDTLQRGLARDQLLNSRPNPLRVTGPSFRPKPRKMP